MTTTDSAPACLSSGEEDEILNAVRRRVLPPDVTGIVDEYEQKIGDRNEFLWKWVHSVLPHIRLTCVDTGVERVTNLKTITTLLVSLYDDLVETHGDVATFDQAFPIPFGYEKRTGETDPTEIDQAYLDCIETVWDEIDTRIRQAPRHDEFRRIFEFDLRQVLDAIEYSGLVNANPGMANMKESRVHEVHNMTMFVYADIDLMHSTGFDRRNLGAVRRAVWHGQQMARFGNWLSTWERELREDDYSSGVVVHALEEGIIDPSELTTDDDESFERVRTKIQEGGSEEYIAELWEYQKAKLFRLESEVDSVDVGQFIAGMETVFKYHLASRGMK